MSPNELYTGFNENLKDAKENNHYRFLKTIQNRDGKYVIYNNKKFLNLSSNDYLGLATNAENLAEFYSGLDRENIVDSFGLGSTSSRLLTGDYALYSMLEKEIAGLYNSLQRQTETNLFNNKDALVFNSGYHANIGIISTLTGKNDLILSDRLNHASIIDGTRLSRAGCIPFEHKNYDQLESILNENRNKYDNVLIISESVFSMDGDIADLKKLVEIKNDYKALLYIDEAHAVGIFGDSGLGVIERDGLINEVDVIVGTFGKALASQGAYAVTDPVIKDYLINNMRTLIYTTALPPVVVNWNIFILNKLANLTEKRVGLLRMAERLRHSLKDKGINTGGESQIVPVVTGNIEKTICKSEELQEKGFLVYPIRPPTVPEGTSRMRISLTANIEWEDIKDIPGIISD